MSLQEFYDSLNESYDIVLQRMAGNEKLLKKFLGKFLDDPNYGRVTAAIVAGDFENMLMAAHTLKGVAGNLGLKKLSEISASIVAEIRKGQYETIQGLYGQLADEYKKIEELLRNNPECLS